MRVNYSVNATTQFQVLSPDQVEQIWLAALRVLEETGTRVYHDGALKLLKDAGAHIESDGLVKFPSALVKQAVQSAPERIALYDRNDRLAMTLEANRVYYGTGSDCPFILDLETGERRNYSYDDVAKASRIADALPNIDFFMSLGLVGDVHGPTYDRHQLLAMVSNTTKPLVVTAVDRDGIADQHEMCCVLRGGKDQFRQRPLLALYAEPSSPLRHSFNAVDKLLYTADEGIPCIYTPCPIAGATAPATAAGVLVQCLAECLSGLVISQLQKPGAPVIIGGVVSIMDMQTTILSYGAPEFSLFIAALTEVVRWLRLPMFSAAGCSDSKVLDEQAAIESAFSLLMATLSGGNLIHDIGFLESALIGSYDMLVLSDEIIGMAKHIARGIRVDDETLAVDVIGKVGPGGHFLEEDHTLRHFREQFWFPRLMDRGNYANWAANGRKTLGDRVRERVLDLLATHQPEPIDAKLLAKLRGIVKRADTTHA